MNNTQTKVTGIENERKSDNIKITNVRKLTFTAMLSAISYILMFLEFPVPLVPSFIKMDFSDLPALIGSFAYGPISGVLICLIKNVIHLMNTSTAGVGELSNFILSAVFVFTAGIVYKRNKTRKNALIGSIAGAVMMSVFSVISNYFFVYPVYANFMPMDAIVGMYSAIFPGIDNLLEALIKVNVPFTFVKALFSIIITFLIYKYISPFLHGSNNEKR